MITPGIAQIEIMRRHPCFDGEAHDRVGRVHLPVARRCNIQCNFCERKVCANLTIQHPGWTARVLSALEAVKLVRSIVNSGEENFVVGVAGPGDPLANEETFEALGAIHHQYPQILKCLSTNGLLLQEKLAQILAAGVSALTVTVNAPDAVVGKYIYSWVRYQGTTYRGQEAAEVLVTSQMCGIKMAIDAGLTLKVNTVLIPGVNDSHLVRLALRLSELGVRLMNIMPLIPSGKMRGYRPPTCEELMRIRQACEAVVPQFYRCEHCRADVVYLP